MPTIDQIKRNLKNDKENDPCRPAKNKSLSYFEEFPGEAIASVRWWRLACETLLQAIEKPKTIEKPKAIEKVYVPFDRLCLGAKFKYDDRKEGMPDTVWIKIYVNLIAKWDEEQLTTNWVGQNVCSFSEGDTKEDLNEEVLLVG